MMMSLGLFIFSLPTVVFQELSHKREVRFAENERIGAPDAFQFIGPGPETITLNGVTAYGINHASASFAVLNRMLQSGRAHTLIDGLGNVYGQYIIRSLDLKKSSFRKFGQAKRTEWSMQLTRVDNPGGAIGNPLLDAAYRILKNPAKMIASKLSVASLSKKLKIKIPGIGP